MADWSPAGVGLWYALAAEAGGRAAPLTLPDIHARHASVAAYQVALANRSANRLHLARVALGVSLALLIAGALVTWWAPAAPAPPVAPGSPAAGQGNCVLHSSMSVRTSPDHVCEARSVRTELDVTLSGPTGGMDARQALVRLEEVLDLLADLEDADRRRPVGQRRVPRSTWTFARLGLGSVRAALAPLEPGLGATYDELDALNIRAVDGFEQVEGAELLPDGWGVNAARTARRLASRLGATPDTGMKLSLIVDGQVRKTVAVTRRASVHLDRALKVRRESIGSVSGSIDSMSVRTKPFLGLWSPRGEGRIKVDVPPQLVEVAKQALGHNAAVRGRIKRNAAGQILGMRATSIEILPAVAEAPPLLGLVGADPDLTGGLSPLAYLEEEALSR